MMTAICGSVPNLTGPVGSSVYASVWGFGNAATASSEQRKGIFPISGTLKNFRVEVSVTPDPGEEWTTITILGVSGGGPGVAISNGSTTAVDTTSHVVSADDILYVSFFSATGVTPSTDIRWSAEFIASAGVLSGVVGTLNNIGTAYFGPQGRTARQTTDAASAVVVPTAGTISNLHATTNGLTGGNFDITLYKNGAPTALTVNVSSDGVIVSDDSDVISVAAGDLISLQQVPNASPTGTVYLQWGMKWTPTVANEAILLGSFGGVSAASTEYGGLAGRSNTDVTESDFQVLLPAGTLKSLYAHSQNAPGAGTSYAYTIVQSGTPSALTTSIADTNTDNHDTTHSVTIANGNEFSISFTPTNTPSSASHSVSSVFVGPITANAMMGFFN